ncbi:hypothetical protein PPERSA_08552 [Pseudocohnilembus persalinus]|uniref:Transmembrane protein n=1 Tax=Pseudocohnilembus persalinus TaxID=266149 RepID=A0A0V0R7F2_PSEPJ|nr:hypothetical protein PPERSA_08552 [Pseudocohnilembus persalinus]|eukprot:KRX10149.1 hypothetical protein PPERSA_08552 [Pseudocohnilembus persalinus]
MQFLVLIIIILIFITILELLPKIGIINFIIYLILATLQLKITLFHKIYILVFSIINFIYNFQKLLLGIDRLQTKNFFYFFSNCFIDINFLHQIYDLVRQLLKLDFQILKTRKS